MVPKSLGYFLSIADLPKPTPIEGFGVGENGEQGKRTGHVKNGLTHSLLIPHERAESKCLRHRANQEWVREERYTGEGESSIKSQAPSPEPDLSKNAPSPSKNEPSPKPYPLEAFTQGTPRGCP